MKPADIASFEQLQAYLRTFTTWDGDHVHDFGGAFILLGSFLDNVKANTTDADLKLIGEYLSEDQKKMLLRLADLARGQAPDG